MAEWLIIINLLCLRGADGLQKEPCIEKYSQCVADLERGSALNGESYTKLEIATLLRTDEDLRKKACD